MKTKKMLMLLLTLSMMATGIIAIASAVEDVPMTVTYSGQDNFIWVLNIKYKNDLAFDGRDVISMKYWYTLDSTVPTIEWIEITPYDVLPEKVVTSTTKVEIHWSFQELVDAGIAGNNDGCRVTGLMVNELGAVEEFYGIGPKFTGAFRPR